MAAAEPDPPSNSMQGHKPYLMPDGRSLRQVLSQEAVLESRRGGSNRKTSKGRREQSQRWDRSFEAQKLGRGTQPQTDEERQELIAVLKLGREGRRRFLNDKLLRDMAGALTAPDIQALFKPVPFGESHASALEEAAAPENQAIWDLFRNIDMDRQQKVLQKWTEHIQQQRDDKDASAPPARTSAAFAALQSWARIPRKARDALKKASAIYVDDMEQPILSYLEQGEAEGELALELSSGFQRLQAHGLAEFHGLACSSREGSDEGAPRLTTLRRRRGAEPRGVPEITCADILLALEEHPQGGVNPEVLRKYVARHLHGQDSSSEASFVLV